MTAVLLMDPKYPFNVGAALRACSVFGVPVMRWTGERVAHPESTTGRLPREERMKEYRNVDWRPESSEQPITTMIREFRLTPVAVEIRDEAEELGVFEHPPLALYVFGPEDGTLGRATLSVCHRFLRIPSSSCLNLAAAVNVVLYDRVRQERQTLTEEYPGAPGNEGKQTVRKFATVLREIAKH